MAKIKEKNDEKIEETIIEKNKPVCNIETFIEENKKMNESKSLGQAFKTWFVLIIKRSILEKIPISEWEQLLEKFLNEKV